MEINIAAGKNALTGLEQQDQFRSITLGNTDESINLSFTRVEMTLQGKPYKPNSSPFLSVDPNGVNISGTEEGYKETKLTEEQLAANKKVLLDLRIKILTLLETELPKLKL